MNINPKIAQAKAALNKNLAVTQSKLAKCVTERDSARAQIEAAVDRAEMAERSARDVERDLKKANQILHALLSNRDAEIERLHRRVVVLETVIQEELDEFECCDEVNRMIVENIHGRGAAVGTTGEPK